MKEVRLSTQKLLFSTSVESGPDWLDDILSVDRI